MSPSSRRAWIEIFQGEYNYSRELVALLAEGVDRNMVVAPGSWDMTVALLAEGVDRNLSTTMGTLKPNVALLAEGVDRNLSTLLLYYFLCVALLAEGVDRNKWELLDRQEDSCVALLAEGVDRNTRCEPSPPGIARRPPRGGRG